ncbi:hypothetical protein ACIBAG_34220 [Streptomyces sp. NPDC051243]|uniref:hypothetical protein n=1 Tax=Streptomyces sp. NPDC051243 TaxID=3365646 RepID=UPI0037888BF9
MARPIARWGVFLSLGALWWWAVLRLALAPEAGALEAAVFTGGWGLSLLPVHCVPKARAVGAVDPRRWVEAWRAGRAVRGGPSTKASPRRRSDAGSAPS